MIVTSAISQKGENKGKKMNGGIKLTGTIQIIKRLLGMTLTFVAVSLWHPCVFLVFRYCM
jgi:hypothetical protein